MKHRMIVGGGGARLHVVESGNANRQAILLLHGFSQCWLTWERQLSSDLTRDYHVVAMDLRGHGESDKPATGYENSQMWADDVDACIRALELDNPVLCGWSYGPLVMLDYVRHYGEEHIGGLHFVGAITKLGSEAALSVLSPEILALVPGLFARDVDQSVSSLDALIRLFSIREMQAMNRYMVLGYNASVPPRVREALFSRVIDNDDLLPRIQKPVLITHGANDAVVKLAAAEQHRAAIPSARVDIVANAGHAVFWDDPETFNTRLARFCSEVSHATHARA